jgi:hypothetical protein
MVDHQRDEPFDGVARIGRRLERRHGRAAHVVVHGAHEFVTVGEAFVEIAFGEARGPAHRAHGQRGPGRTAE